MNTCHWSADCNRRLNNMKYLLDQPMVRLIFHKYSSIRSYTPIFSLDWLVHFSYKLDYLSNNGIDISHIDIVHSNRMFSCQAWEDIADPYQQNIESRTYPTNKHKWWLSKKVDYTYEMKNNFSISRLFMYRCYE